MKRIRSALILFLLSAAPFWGSWSANAELLHLCGCLSSASEACCPVEAGSCCNAGNEGASCCDPASGASGFFVPSDCSHCLTVALNVDALDVDVSFSQDATGEIVDPGPETVEVSYPVINVEPLPVCQPATRSTLPLHAVEAYQTTIRLQN